MSEADTTIAPTLLEALADPDLPPDLHVATMCYCVQHAIEDGEADGAEFSRGKPIDPDDVGFDCDDHWQLCTDPSGVDPDDPCQIAATFTTLTGPQMRAVARLVNAAGRLGSQVARP